MGYRYYMGVIPKEVYSTIKECKTKEDIAIKMNILQKYNKIDNYLYSGDWLSQYNIDEVSDMAFRLNKKTDENKFFDDNSLNAIYNSDESLFKITQENLLELIEIYEKEIKENYLYKIKEIEEERDTENPNEALKTAIRFIEAKSMKWERRSPLIKDLNANKLSNSYSAEDSIFNLLYLYKTVNFNTHIVYINGR